jgi:hypothetical protein
MIERVIEMVSTGAYPLAGEALATFSADAQHYLTQGGILDDVFVETTDEVGCLLRIEASVTSRAQNLHDVSRTLRQAWMALAFAEFEAASCDRYSDGTVLRFVAAKREGGGVFVSGEVIAKGGAYAQLAERYEHDFGDMRALVPMPTREP